MPSKKFWKGLVGGSLVLLITINLFNILNFAFNLVMARMLSLAEYGVLTTLIYIIFALTIFSESIQTVISRYAAKESDNGKVKNLLNKSNKKALKISIYAFVAYALISIALYYLLEISYSLLILTGLMIFTTFLLPVGRGVLQGKRKFKAFGNNMVLEGAIKLVLSVLLVFIGWGVYGAMTGVVIGAFASLFLLFPSLKYIRKEKEKKSKTEGIYGYTKPVFIAVTSVILFISLDMVLARILFSPNVVGAYAIASQIAKIIFLGTIPISKAMFPLSVSSRKEKDSDKLLYKSLYILLGIIIISLLALGFFPNLWIYIFSGKIIPLASSILIYLAVAFSIMSIANLIVLHKLSKGKTKNNWTLAIAVLAEVVLLSIFSTNLFLFSLALIVSSALFLWASIVLLK